MLRLANIKNLVHSGVRQKNSRSSAPPQNRKYKMENFLKLLNFLKLKLTARSFQSGLAESSDNPFMYHILVIYALTNSDLIEFRRLGIFGFAVGASVGVCPDRRSVPVCMYVPHPRYVRTYGPHSNV